jgi:GTP-binding protein
MHGARGEDIYIDVPVGTMIKYSGSSEIICDLDKPDMIFKIATGGKGGKGNARFVSSRNPAPKIAEKGTKGEEFWIEMELKLLSEAAIIGMPNAGKSTLISSISNARPKIADYPFTTLVPNLGVVYIDDLRQCVVSDIPGLIEGASQNAGLGHRFLRHIERAKILVHLISPENDNIEKNYDIIRNELREYSEILFEKKEIVVITKKDILDENQVKEIKKIFKKRKLPVYFISAVTGDGLKEFKEVLWDFVTTQKKEDEEKEKQEINQTPVFRIEEEDRNIFSVEKINGVYFVRGKKIEEYVQKSDFENALSVDKLQRQLEKTGVFRALEEHGIKQDDEVEISGYRFNYSK